MKQELIAASDLDQLKLRIDKIRQIVAPDLDDTELNFYLEYCRKTGLDPVTRQIYATKRKSKNQNGEWESKITIGTSIDGQRLIAQRTGEYEGQLGPFWCGPDGRWTDVWLKSNPPAAARIGVLRRGFREPVWAVATFGSYAQRRQDGNLGPMWQKMPDVMIAKCAEALALRKAFPNELSGLYADEEMQQADIPEKNLPRNPPPASTSVGGQHGLAVPEKKSQGAVASPIVPPGAISTASLPDASQKTNTPTDIEIENFQKFTTKHGWKNSQVIDLLRAMFNKASPRTCSHEQLNQAADIIEVKTPAQYFNTPIKAEFPRETEHELDPGPPEAFDPNFDLGRLNEMPK